MSKKLRSFLFISFLCAILYFEQAQCQTRPQKWRAIDYVPSIASFDETGLDDLYGDKYEDIWKRDLELIGNKSDSLGANIVILTNWEGKADHTKFIDTAAANGLYVIPCFPLDSYHYADIWSLEARKKIQDDYRTFVNAFIPTTGTTANVSNPWIPLIKMGTRDPNQQAQYGGYEPIGAYWDVLAFLGYTAIDPVAQNRTNLRKKEIAFHDYYVQLAYDDAGLKAFGGYFTDSKAVGANILRWGIPAVVKQNAKTTMPPFVMKLVADSYVQKNNSESEAIQKKDLQLQNQALKTWTGSAGMVVTEFQDVWWRADKLTPLIKVAKGCPDKNPARQAQCGTVYNLTDGVLNPEWQGITRQYFHLFQICIEPKISYAWLADKFHQGTAGYSNGTVYWNKAKCLNAFFLVPLMFALVCLAVGIIGCILLGVTICLAKRKKGLNFVGDGVALEDLKDKSLPAVNGSAPALIRQDTSRFLVRTLRGGSVRHSRKSEDEPAPVPLAQLFDKRMGDPEVKKSPAPIRAASPAVARAISAASPGIIMRGGSSRWAEGPSQQITSRQIDKTDPRFRKLEHTPSVWGLPRIGQTCFLNTVVQVLTRVDPLMEFFSGEYERHINYKNPDGYKGEVARAFAGIVKALQTKEANSALPHLRILENRFNEKQGKDHNQHDAQEFLIFLLDALHEDLNDTSIKPAATKIESRGRSENEVADESWRAHLARGDSFIVQNFHGLFKYRVVCRECKKSSTGFEPFVCLSLPIPNKDFNLNLDTLLQLFTEEEVLAKKNAWKCEHCNKVNEAKIRYSLWKIPKTLFIQFKRFNNDKKIDSLIKYNLSSVDISSSVDEAAPTRPPQLDLIGVVCHHGKNPNEGHYSAYVKNKKKDMWFHVDDDKHTRIFPNQVLHQDAYLLVYEPKSSDNKRESRIYSPEDLGNGQESSEEDDKVIEDPSSPNPQQRLTK